MQSLALNFRGHAKYPSVKNMVLVDAKDESKEGLLFCKAGLKEYYMELSAPLSPLIAFGVVLSSFDFKLLCQ